MKSLTTAAELRPAQAGSYVAWVGGSLEFSNEVFRYRTLYPAIILEGMGWKCRISQSPDEIAASIADFSAVVIASSLSQSVAALAATALDANVPIYLDLSEEIVGQLGDGNRSSELNVTFDTLVPSAAAIITTSPLSARRLADFGYTGQILEIPDCIESESLRRRACAWLLAQRRDSRAEARWRAPFRFATRFGRRVLRALRYPRRSMIDLETTLFNILHDDRHDEACSVLKTAVSPDVSRALRLDGKKILWFGAHGFPNSDDGMATLLRVAAELQAVYAIHPFTLVVCSNDKSKWQKLIVPIGIPTVYAEMNHRSVGALLAACQAVIDPRGQDNPSFDEAAKRAVLAITNGKRIVAQSRESLEWLATNNEPSEFFESLCAVLDDAPKQLQSDSHLQKTVEALFGERAVGERWASVFAQRRIPQSAYRASNGKKRPPKLVVCLNTPTDSPIGFAVFDRARALGIEAGMIVTAAACEGNPRIVADLIQRRVAPTVLDVAQSVSLDFRWLRGATALFCPSETSDPAHAVPHALTRLANAANIATFTAQHGLMNIGLTQRSETGIVIASSVIFTWQDPALLPEWVSEDLRQRCVGVGRLATVPDLSRGAGTKDEVGIYENLHWHLYPDDFRRQFLKGLEQLARSHPDINFTIVPHPAGRWSVNNRASIQWPPNLNLINPSNSVQAGQSGPERLGDFSLVVTTPSSIAVDAAIAGKPIAIWVPQGFDASYFAPLTLCRTVSDLSGFIESRGRQQKTLRESFLDRVLRRDGDPVSHAISVMFPEAPVA